MQKALVVIWLVLGACGWRSAVGGVAGGGAGAGIGVAVADDNSKGAAIGAVVGAVIGLVVGGIADIGDDPLKCPPNDQRCLD